MKTFILAMVVLCCLGACSENNSQKTADKMIETWFDKGDWKEGFQAKPAPSVDKKQLYEHYQKFPQRWKTVFDFIKNNDLTTTPLGITHLSEDVSFNMQEYRTHGLGEQILEAHLKYIDLQYVISGRELIGSGRLSDATNVTPYDDSTDYAGYKLSIFPCYLADSEYFFIFFPDQPHLPGVNAGEETQMRKIVFKIKVD
jgi:YhcH/YjgK/YiaL family protein